MANNLNLSKTSVNRVAAVLSEVNPSFISVSPNPCSGQITVVNQKFVTGNTYPLDIYSASGARVLQTALSAQQSTVTFAGAPGDYYVNLNTQDGLAVRKVTMASGSN